MECNGACCADNVSFVIIGVVITEQAGRHINRNNFYCSRVYKLYQSCKTATQRFVETNTKQTINNNIVVI